VRSRTLLLVLLVALPVLRIVATYRVFSQTNDEPFHVAAGYQWLTTRGYRFDLQHPPLARVFLASMQRPAMRGLLAQTLFRLAIPYWNGTLGIAATCPARDWATCRFSFSA
jgi:hypothetical protein